MNIITNFDYGREIHDRQIERIGATKEARNGTLYRYCRIGEAFAVGQALRQATHADLVDDSSNAKSDVTSASAKGTNKLTATGHFDKANVSYKGALGQIVNNAGSGQVFYVAEKLSADALRIHVISTGTDPFVSGQGGWQTALTTSSEFSLGFPGLALKVNASGDQNKLLEGFAQVAATADDIGKHLWVPFDGVMHVKADTSETSIVQHEPLIVNTHGFVEAYHSVSRTDAAYSPDATGMNAIAEAIHAADLRLTNVVGRALLGDIEGTVDKLILAHISVGSRAPSYDLAFTQNPYNVAEIG